MNECKCGRIPPCYGGKKFRIHEELEKIKPCSEETAQGVIEALRNASELSEASNRLAEHIFEDILKSIKSNDMEEKKTKKMTKAEAFEYLKGKKAYVAGKSAEIQKVLFSAGYFWGESSASQKIESTEKPFLYMGNEGSLMYGSNMELFIRDTNEEISADDILSIEIVEENRSEDELVEIVELGKKIQCLLSKLSGHRHVVITEDDVILYDEGTSLFHSDPF